MNINPLTFMSQFGKMKDEAKRMEEKLQQLRINGSAASLVQVTINGKFDLIDIKIDPIAVDERDIPMLETLIKSAFVDASNKAKETIAQELQSTDLAQLQSIFK
ncbi:YbaB/EbfC family nucleoid-associated protein [Entomospira culicis]|uniref:Nucleoid-associated protein HCT48_07660 n=1 Tax=Entomospira culicis TaxID=2719989 RepID=A0A968GHS7_9SPIO|nr:YbaB/EbfC family nucleoid-associated protein [Entomospira culicis]NIZ19867.1 YbaB/EbfC family nucleoid-associated protein [Entomospira culicis]NIZ70081.1 YbaB/EbfC family nucleoid-associated protein [Entomospira culicis]WDI37185.1 YbaB/EbfC family nucleoid-associated protein [Entomospira culicis]WDI38814.1 YbaB/EbfC family nucleoid-associated protein [Entomospira culicis]